MTPVFSSRNNSKFIDWIETRREISAEELDRIFPGTLENFGFDEAPPEKFFIYRGDVWIALLNHSSVREEIRFFWTHIEKDSYESCNSEELEMRLYLWAIDENCEL